MSKLPIASERTLVKVLERRNFFARQKGSHMMMRRTTPPHLTVSVPDHKELAPGTLRSLLRDVGITIDELNELLRKI